MYRPQFDYCPPPAGFTDEEFIYSFDGSNTPALGICVAPGQQNQNIPLETQNDADFFWRATKVRVNPQFGVALQFKDPFGNFLSDDYVPSWLYGNNSYTQAPGSVSTVREPETLLLKGARPLVNIANLAPTYAPNQVSGAVGLGVPQQANSTFPYGGRIYMFVQTSGPGISAVVSTDGVNFTPSDLANDIPTVSSGPATYWDRTSNTVYLCYKTAGGNPLTIQSFNLATGRWNAVINAAGPTDLTPQFLWLRPNGSFLVSGISAAFATGYAGVQLLAGVWSAEFDIAVNIEALPSFGTGWTGYPQRWSVMDSTGVTHFILKTSGTSGPPNWDNRYFYQQVAQNNTLGVFQEFNAAQQQNPIGSQFLSDVTSIEGNLEIAEGQLVWGICFDAPTGSVGVNEPLPAVYVGSPLSNPVWNASGNIGPVRSLLNSNVYPIARGYPAIRYDNLSKTLYAMWPAVTATALQLNFGFNTSQNWLTGNWQSYVSLPNLGAPFGSVGGARISLQYGINGPYVGFTFNGQSDTVEYFAGQSTQGLKIMFRGRKRFRTGVQPVCGS